MSKKPKHDDPEEVPETETAEQAELDISTVAPAGPVECLGITFPSDAARREYFLKELAKKLKDPAFRKIEGFPLGEDEDILALSDPPYYTACPNPWLAEFVKHYGKPYSPKDKYHREPFAADVSEGKNHPIYTAHAYHTKVPHRAIMRYILYYTQPGDLIFDGFTGTGMTGVAAELCGDRTEVQQLGYRVQNDGIILNEHGQPFCKLGARRAILNDLSPAATFIAFNYNTPTDATHFLAVSMQLLREIDNEWGWMFATLCNASEQVINAAVKALAQCRNTDECRELLGNEAVFKARIGHPNAKFSLKRINYVVWSDVFICSECGADLLFWDVASDPSDWSIRDKFNCSACGASLTKQGIERKKVTLYDRILNRTVVQSEQRPALIHTADRAYPNGKTPDAFDRALLEVIEAKVDPTQNMPSSPLPDGFNTAQPKSSHGFTHVHHFYTKRNLIILATLAKRLGPSRQYVNITSSCMVLSKLYRFRSQGGSLGAGGGPMNGTLYVPSLVKEIPALKVLKEHITKTAKLKQTSAGWACRAVIATGDAGTDGIASDTLDYLFVDPPFGGNINYSELNFIWESWLRVFTNNKREAITNRVQKKELPDYQTLMLSCFREFFRVLKPGRWMTIEFSNTQASIWNSIQTTLQEAGFVVANVAALDKKQGSFKAVTTPTAVKQDLVISAYKPNGGLEERFAKTAESEAGVWDFIRTHLNNLPVVKPKGGLLEPITERDARILFDRTVAFYVRHGIPVPISSPEFQAGLAEKFPERDGMYFLSDQAAEYDKVRMKMEGIGQLTIFVDDERSAVDWLRNYLKNKPSKYNDVQPVFFEQLNQTWKKWETKPELRALLDQYFLCYQGEGAVPSQIHSYLSTNFKELRTLPADHAMLRAKARDRWFVPDPRKNADVEQLREKHLLDEFWSYLPPGYEAAARTRKPNEPELPGMQQAPPKQPKGKRIAIVRTEAIRVGFNFCFGRNDYTTIIAVAQHIPDDVIQNDEQLQMIYDSAVTRTGGEPE